MSCHRHFEMYLRHKSIGLTWAEIDTLTKDCEDCIAARQAEIEHTQLTKTICPDAPYGQHIAIRCTNCKAEGTTKNIKPLGCRSLFISCECPGLDTIEAVTA